MPNSSQPKLPPASFIPGFRPLKPNLPPAARLALLASCAVGVLAGCQPLPRTGGYILAAPQPLNPVVDLQAQVAALPAATSSGVSTYPGILPVNVASIDDVRTVENLQRELRDRLDRVEKALLRLDRRMQLVERNELNRMSEAQPAAALPSALPPLARAPESETGVPTAALAAAAPTEDYGSYQTVSANGLAQQPVITSALQAAPQPQAWSPEPAAARDVQTASLNRLPSLADPAPATGRAPAGTSALRDVAIWTVRYEPEKVWPDREQLPGSRDLVEALRNRGQLTLYARGPNPNGIEFRNRVAALSRYLAKVSSQDTVPIATLPAPHLDGNTIELLATP